MKMTMFSLSLSKLQFKNQPVEKRLRSWASLQYFKHEFENDDIWKLNCSVTGHVFSPQVTTQENCAIDQVGLGASLAMLTGLLHDRRML